MRHPDGVLASLLRQGRRPAAAAEVWEDVHAAAARE